MDSHYLDVSEKFHGTSRVYREASLRLQHDVLLPGGNTPENSCNTYINTTCFTFVIILSKFTFNPIIPSERLLLTKFENELAVNLVLSVNTICNIYFSYIYVTFIFCNFFSIFISSCIFIFYFNCKGYVFFSIFS